MSEKKIPCSDCATEKRKLEMAGRYRVTGCAPIAGEDGWCLIRWERIRTGAPSAPQTASVDGAVSEKRIPCADCATETTRLQATGRYRVIGCAPIAAEDGWCTIRWQRVSPTAATPAGGSDAPVIAAPVSTPSTTSDSTPGPPVPTSRSTRERAPQPTLNPAPVQDPAPSARETRPPAAPNLAPPSPLSGVFPGSLRIDGDFIVGGARHDRLTPHFSYGEFVDVSTSAAPRIHLDLISGLQRLRVRMDAKIKINGLGLAGTPAGAIDGQFVWITAQSMHALQAAARAVRKENWLANVLRVDDRLYVAVDPQGAPPVDAATALDAAVHVTAGFETSGDPYQQVTGNFDQQGLSFGPAQINFGTGTLPPVFAAMRAADEPTLRACFGVDYDRWLEVLARTKDEQVAWADALSRGDNKADFAQPWKGYLQAVGRVPVFRRVLVDTARERYGKKMRRALGQLRRIAPDIVVDRQNCITALYDLCTQQGSLDYALQNIAARVSAERPQDQRALVRIAVYERGATARRPYRADCISRRLGILERVPVHVEHSGKKATRSSRNLWQVRSVAVAGLDTL